MKYTLLIAAGTLTSAVALFGAIASANMAPPQDIILGISVAPSPDGPRVTALEKGSSAERAGVRVGDLLLGVDGRYTKPIPLAELDAYLKKPKWHADLVVVHDGTAIELVRVYR